MLAPLRVLVLLVCGLVLLSPVATAQEVPKKDEAKKEEAKKEEPKKEEPKKEEGKKSPAPAELKKLIDDSIKWLSDKDHAALLDRIVEPAFKEKMKEKGAWDELVEKFGDSHAEKLLTILKTLPAMEPTLNADSSEASYLVPKDLKAPRDAITFVKVKDVWYLRN